MDATTVPPPGLGVLLVVLLFGVVPGFAVTGTVMVLKKLAGGDPTFPILAIYRRRSGPRTEVGEVRARTILVEYVVGFGQAYTFYLLVLLGLFYGLVPRVEAWIFIVPPADLLFPIALGTASLVSALVLMGNLGSNGTDHGRIDGPLLVSLGQSTVLFAAMLTLVTHGIFYTGQLPEPWTTVAAQSVLSVLVCGAVRAAVPRRLLGIRGSGRTAHGRAVQSRDADVVAGLGTIVAAIFLVGLLAVLAQGNYVPLTPASIGVWMVSAGSIIYLSVASGSDDRRA